MYAYGKHQLNTTADCLQYIVKIINMKIHRLF